MSDSDELDWPGLHYRWPARPDLNESKWGEQDVETLLLAMQEELDELTRAHLEARTDVGERRRLESFQKELKLLGVVR